MNGNRIVPKLCGADVELGNFILGHTRFWHSGPDASRALLHEIEGWPNRPTHTDSRTGWIDGTGAAEVHPGWQAVPSYNPQDIGRRFLGNGGCAYIDLDHLEICTPEVVSAFDFVAAWHAMLRIARGALVSANAKLPPDQRLQAIANNSDGQSHSYGGHLNFLVLRRTWDNLFLRRMHYLQYLASFQASSIVLTGQGKVGSENNASPADFQLGQRADFFETLVGEQTTCNRPIVNSRDESLCGGAFGLARVHCIFFDSTLCHVATALKVGLMQIVLAMIEAERIRIDLLLEDPLDAVRRWSHDPELRTRARLLSGRKVTAVELQQAFLEEAARFAEDMDCVWAVPDVGVVLELWDDTLRKLAQRDWPALVPRLDWVLKRSLLQRALERRPQLTWTSPALKHLDQMYGSLAADEGLYWACERDGVVDRVVDEARIARLVDGPPSSTRAWARTRLLRALPQECIQEIDWDAVTVRLEPGELWRVNLDNPLAWNEAATGEHFAGAADTRDLLRRLGASRVPRAHREPQRRLDPIFYLPAAGHGRYN